MANSRIFVRGLPPSMTEEAFKQHFSSQSPVTDVKLLPHRRIGYVGFRTDEEALQAVKYFNKSYIRLSRIGVELADNNFLKPQAKSLSPRKAHHSNIETPNTNPLKRKRESDESRPKHAAIASGDEAAHVVLSSPHVAATSASSSPSIPTGTQSGVSQKRLSGAEENPPERDSEEILQRQPASDSDWMRSRTSRLLGLVDDDDDEGGMEQANKGNETLEVSPNLLPTERTAQEPTPPPEAETSTNPDNEDDEERRSTQNNQHVEAIRDSQRLFIRNLPYDITEEEVTGLFKKHGTLQEVHVPFDTRSGEAKGFAFVQFEDAESAVAAYDQRDGTVFQGRLLHVLPAAAKKDSKLDEFAIAKLPIKKQRQLQKKAEASTSTFSWNSLFMNADAVLSSISDRLKVPKSELLDPSSSDAAVRQAQAETHVIQETKAYLTANGVDLNAFKSRERGDTTILVKNFPYGTSPQDLSKLFAAHGEVSRILMPPSGTIAIVEFLYPAQTRSAFAALAYRKYGDSILFLEKGPKGLLDGEVGKPNQQTGPSGTQKHGASDLLQADADDEAIETSTLFVRNLNFATTNDRFRGLFEPLDGFISARIKTKTDPKKPGQILSMGFGFVEFRSPSQARAAMSAMNGYNLDGHQLLIKASHRGHDAAEERRRKDDARNKSARKSKIVIKNLPFEASKKDVMNLFKSYGQLRAVRVPKKFDNSRKGFAFAEFTNPREAENAMEALSNTHLLGRRLVLDYAAGEAENPEEEIEKMQRKIGKQSDNVALQHLASRSERKKVRIGEEKEAEDG